MPVLEKERTETRTQVIVPTVEKRRTGLLVWILSLLALAAVATVGVVMVRSMGEETETGRSSTHPNHVVDRMAARDFMPESSALEGPAPHHSGYVESAYDPGGRDQRHQGSRQNAQ